MGSLKHTQFRAEFVIQSDLTITVELKLRDGTKGRALEKLLNQFEMNTIESPSINFAAARNPNRAELIVKLCLISVIF